MNLINLLEHLEKRPQIYIREKRLDLLEIYVNGYFLCQSENNLANIQDTLFRNEFYYWLKDKFQLNDNVSWLDLILQLSEKEKKESFDLFFHLLNIFKKEKQIFNTK